MFKKILVPTDGSEYARRAISTALELARQFGSDIELVHVDHVPQVYWGEPYAITFTAPIEEMVQKGGELILEESLKGLDVAGVNINKRQIKGYPSEVILNEVRHQDIELVIMGSHGHRPLAGAMLGSVSQRVLAHAACPVLIVK